MKNDDGGGIFQEEYEGRICTKEEFHGLGKMNHSRWVGTGGRIIPFAGASSPEGITGNSDECIHRR